MASNGGKKDDWDPQVPHVRKEPRPDFTKPLPRGKLPKEIQDTLDNDEKLWELVYEGKAGESTDSSVRYAGYAARLRTIMMAAHRYIAYTSDIGESFRPIAHPILVRSAYGISWAYIGGDVAHEGYKAYLQNQQVLHPEKMLNQLDVQKTNAVGEKKKLGPGITGGTPAVTDLPKPGKVTPIDDYRTVMAQRAVFQSLASMGLPAFTIHTLVRYSGRALKNNKNTIIRTWGPIGLGLAAVPALPYLFDKPVEHAVEWTFRSAFRAIGGPEAVDQKPTQRIDGAAKEKEL